MLLESKRGCNISDEKRWWWWCGNGGGKPLIAKSFFYMVGAFGAFGCFNEGDLFHCSAYLLYRFTWCGFKTIL
jgi:hypothetical protein